MQTLKYKIGVLLLIYIGWVFVLALQKPIFLLIYTHSWIDLPSVWWHGVSLDLSIAGYLSVIPGLILFFSSLPIKQLHIERATFIYSIIHNTWLIIASVAVSLSFVANIALYSYWQFPLDATPIFFLTSSPKAAMASIEWWQLLLGIAAVTIISIGIYLFFKYLLRTYQTRMYSDLAVYKMIILLVVVTSLFVPIRGGITVSTMNTGHAYYSDNQLLNHAAVNPLFSFMESMAHQEDFSKMYRFMDEAKAKQLVKRMIPQSKLQGKGKVSPLLSCKQPNIYLIIMESFSDTLMQKKSVTPNLNAIKQQGLYFSNFYANSYRTDRGLLSILYGYPSPATVSLMKYPKKTASLTSMPQLLKQAGWNLQYYYGGDADFTNMRSFLHNQGFENIVEDVDFPISQRICKWGVPDSFVFQRVKNDIQKGAIHTPQFTVIQTSSSHEPFDVPYKKLKEKHLNAFAYTDSCIGNFVHYLQHTNHWNHSLVILVPDHLGAWPVDINNYTVCRFHIPLIFTGGAMRQSQIINTFASQQDIAATVLSMLGINHSKMKFSKDIMDKNIPHFAYFMMNDGFGITDSRGSMVYDCKRGKVVQQIGLSANHYLPYAQAYIQTIFNDIASR